MKDIHKPASLNEKTLTFLRGKKKYAEQKIVTYG